MKKILLLLISLCFFQQNYAQKVQYAIHAGTFWDKGLCNFIENSNTYAYTNTSFQTKLGAEAMYKFSKNIGLGLGYDFSYRYMEVNLFTGNPVSSFTGAKVYTHDFPFFMEYKINFKSGLNRALVGRLGFGAEIFAPEYYEFGGYVDETIFTTTFRYGLYYTIYAPVNPIPYFHAYIGLHEGFGPHANFRLGVAYKLVLYNFDFELYNYNKNFNSPPAVIGYTTITRRISEIGLQLAYIIR